jgi:cytochrome d ubiquinol oxidase subunit I
MVTFPFPYIATTAGWMVAELGRQPWIIYGLKRTMDATSPTVPGGNVAFTTLGFMGLYVLMGILFLYLIAREIGRGPAAPGESTEAAEPELATKG